MTDVRVEVFLENFLVEMETVDTLGVDQAFKKKKKNLKKPHYPSEEVPFCA